MQSNPSPVGLGTTALSRSRQILTPSNAPAGSAETLQALEALLRWARCSGRPFDAVLPLITERFAPGDIVAFMDHHRPGAASLGEVYERF